jgi:hypothetical protein
MSAESKTGREQKMREALAQQLASGLTQRAFAASIGMKTSTFRWWKREITRRDQQLAEPQEASRGAAFLPVEVIDSAPASSPGAAAATSLALHLGDLHIAVPHGFDAAHLRRVVSALRAC